MLIRQSVNDYFPEGHTFSRQPGHCFQLRPLQSRFEGSTCYIEFHLGRIVDRDVELTGWYRQIQGSERVPPLFLDGKWCADFNS